MIDDSLQALTLAIHEMILNPKLFESSTMLNLNEMDDSEIFKLFPLNDWIKKAISLGDAWLARNKNIYSKFTIPITIVRWSSWLNVPAFDEAIKFSDTQFKVNEEYRTAILKNVQTFLNRQKNYENLSSAMKNLAERFCIAYLKEETSVMRALWPTLNCNYEVYPSARNEAMTATYKLWIEPISPHLLIPVALRFNRKRIEASSVEYEAILSSDHSSQTKKL
jgi:hypothetical protein